MRYNDQRLYTVELEGANERQLLLSLAIAAFRAAPSLEDEGSVHPDFRPEGGISIGEASDFVRGSHVIMLFAKGRMPMTHLEIVGRFGTAVSVRVAMFDGDAEKLFSDAAVIMEEKFGVTAEDLIEDDFDIVIEIDPSFLDLAPTVAPSHLAA